MHTYRVYIHLDAPKHKPQTIQADSARDAARTAARNAGILNRVLLADHTQMDPRTDVWHCGTGQKKGKVITTVRQYDPAAIAASVATMQEG